jgi:hypothetical protein
MSPRYNFLLPVVWKGYKHTLYNLLTFYDTGDSIKGKQIRPITISISKKLMAHRELQLANSTAKPACSPEFAKIPQKQPASENHESPYSTRTRNTTSWHSTESQGRRNCTDGDQLRHVELLGELHLALGRGSCWSPPASAASGSGTRRPMPSRHSRCSPPPMPSRSSARQDRGPAFIAGLDQRADEGIWFHGLRDGWTERKTERRKRRVIGVDRDGDKFLCSGHSTMWRVTRRSPSFL